MATEKTVAEKTAEVDELKSEFPLDPQAIIEVTQELKDSEAGLEFLKNLESELFPA